MNLNSPRYDRATGARSLAAALALLPFLALGAPLLAQQPELKPAPTPDPVKGWADPSPLTDAERQMLRQQPRAVTPQQQRTAESAAADSLYGADQRRRDHVDFDAQDGHIWAIGSTYKASFGADGFTYIPYLGGDAPRNYPVSFTLRSVQVGGREVPLAACQPVHEGMRVAFDRGQVRELYDLAMLQVEQTFVVDTPLAGDVDVVIGVTSELQAQTGDGLSFTNERGGVTYGQAHVVTGSELLPVATEWLGDAIRIHVPAAQRPAGALVIDPILQSSNSASTLTSDSSQPDIAYDASSDQYLVVWQTPFSANDYDVWSEFRNGVNCTPVAGSVASIDFTSFSHQNPRVANLNAYDRFLVVSQRFDGTHWAIYGRLRLALSAPHPIVWQISDPALGGDCLNPDIGGDSGNGGQWCVVFERDLSATDTDILGRIVNADTSLAGGTVYIENSGSSIYVLPHVSQSNGNGLIGSPQWVTVYNYRFSATDYDIFGAAVVGTPSGYLLTTPNSAIDTSSFHDLYPEVSSPAVDFGGNPPLFMMTYERQSPYEGMARLVRPYSFGFVNEISAVNLTQTFGLPGFWVRPESDGNRFAVLTGAATIGVTTLAFTGSALVVHDGFDALPGTPQYPRICSQRSGGGQRTDYGIAYIDIGPTPDHINASAYGGYVSGPTGIYRRVMACQGLSISSSGRAFLGESMQFSLGNYGADIPGFAFGNTAPATTLLCAQCPFGVLFNTAILVVGPSLTINVPTTANLVGFAGSLQGFALGSGPCVATLHFSDTLDFVVR